MTPIPPNRSLLSGLVLCAVLSASCATTTDDYNRDIERRGVPMIQGMVGVTSYDDLTFEDSPSADPSVEAETDLSSLPTIGAAWQWPMHRGKIDWGIESSFFASFQNDRTSVYYGGGGAVIKVKNELLLLDVGGGPYISAFPSERMRLYASAGPLLMYGHLSSDVDDDGTSSDSNDSDFSFGAAARLGVEFLLNNGDYMGFSVRFHHVEMDFSDYPGVDMDGITFLFTYSY